MTIDWRPLDQAMEGRDPIFWWRDDDAVAPTAALDRLIAMAQEVGSPLTLASIPATTTNALATRLDTANSVDVAVHGWSHESHAPQGEKNAEFGAHRCLEARTKQVVLGLDRLHTMFGDRAIPVFIPPWNRMAPDMPAALAASGYRGYSIYAERQPRLVPIPRFDAHLDPIDWRGTRSVVDPATLLAQVVDLLKDDAPIGLMTHHLVHDEAIWKFVGSLTRRLTARGAHWTSLRTLITAQESPTVQ